MTTPPLAGNMEMLRRVLLKALTGSAESTARVFAPSAALKRQAWLSMEAP